MLGRSFAAAAALACALSTAGIAAAQQTLAAVKARGQLVCGINPSVPGFSLPDSRGEWQGLDTELCHSLAVAIFNDRSKVRFQPLSSFTRFTALGNGEVDVLFRTSTQTMLRDTTLGLRHVTTYFFDGHGFMVRANSGVAKASDMRGATICLVQGTTNEQVTADHFRSIDTPFQPVLFERTDQASSAAARRSTPPSSRAPATSAWPPAPSPRRPASARACPSRSSAWWTTSARRRR